MLCMLYCSYLNIVSIVLLPCRRGGHNSLVMGLHLVLQESDKKLSIFLDNINNEILKNNINLETLPPFFNKTKTILNREVLLNSEKLFDDVKIIASTQKNIHSSKRILCRGYKY